MKLHVTADTPFSVIDQYLQPVKEYNQEKIRSQMYDDWDEYAHTKKWIETISASQKENNPDNLDIYYLEEAGTVYSVVFILSGSHLMQQFLQENNICSTDGPIAQLSCFHVAKGHRGIGRQWLETEVFPDLKKQGIAEVYVKSSHHKALGLYGKLGTKIGNYIGISDHELYQRFGYIYKILL